VRILLVEDQREIRTMLRVGMRRHAELEVVGEAESLAAALSLAEQVEPQTIILDLQLPDATPRQAYTTIRAGAPDSTIVVFSARESDRNWYEQRGTRFFGKGSDPVDQLVEWLCALAAPSQP
jgi:DNA-binding NarL/FixJ family response regulator